MTSITLLYLHGFLSTASGPKAQFFHQQCADQPGVTFESLELNPTPRDFEYMTVTGQINRLRQALLTRPPGTLRLIGSSLGGQVAVHYAHRFGGVERLLLLAPALRYRADRYPAAELAQWERDGVKQFEHAWGGLYPLRVDYHVDRLRYTDFVPPPAPTLIIHGRQDEVVPLSDSQHYAATYPDHVRLVEVEAGHLLNDRLADIWQEARSFLLA